MSKRKKGKGVEQEISLKGNEELVNLDISKIVPNPNQPRKTFNPKTIKELAESIKASKQLVPIIVSPLKDGRHLIVDGERRYRAATQYLKLNTMPALIIPMTEDQIEINSLAVNVHRDDLISEEKEDYVYKLYERLKTVSTVALRVGWSMETVSYYLTGYRTRKDLSARVEIKIPEDTSTLVFNETERLKDNPQARAEFIQMVNEQRDGLRVNRDHLRRYSKIYADADRDIQQKIYLGELTFQEAEKIVKSLEKVKQRMGGEIPEEQRQEALDFLEADNERKKKEEKLTQGTFEDMLSGKIRTGTSERTRQREEIYTLTDEFHGYRDTRRALSLAHDIHFKAHYDDENTFVRIQNKVKEVLAHVGAEENLSEEKRMKQLEELSELNALVNRITTMVQPLIDSEIKNSRKIDVQKLR